MNRRQFTASLAAVAVSPRIPFAASANVATQSAAVPAGTYAWAELIARAQKTCSPQMLIRHLSLSPEAAQSLFDEMLRDGVLRAPGLSGVAQAVRPIEAPWLSRGPDWQKLHRLVSDQGDTGPLAKDDPVCLGCDEQTPEDTPDASATEHVQESPEER